ncbi:MAG TPA: DEAD/DEAH box helicase family protein [Nitriliruptoraceae bacterium]|nr:DEAD/DEAH box helicase family protein [Nitriliruptoraceae bacterium]
MARHRSRWVCGACGHVTSQWVGRCNACDAWGEVAEATASTSTTTARTAATSGAAAPSDPGANSDGKARSEGASSAGSASPTGDQSRRPAADGVLGPLTGLDLRDWQVDAFAAWATAGCRGVVEAITGAGKTRLAMAAVRVVVGRGGVALVLVPTLELQAQWVRALASHAPSARVGRLGGGGDDDFSRHDVVVATPNSAAAVPITPREGQLGLLVADEAHRYGAPTWAQALRESYAMRLALTATYERGDDGVVDVLGPYFGGVVADYGYRAATRDGVIAPFAVALVSTALDDDERRRYDEADRAARRARGVLLSQHGLPRHPRDTLRAAIDAVADGDQGRRRRDDPVVVAARDYLVRLRARRDVAAQAAGKLTVAGTVAPHLDGHRTLVFCDTVDQAEMAARVISRQGPLAEELHGGLAADKRRIRMAQFRNGNLPVVVAPRVLDEGVDVPDADVAVVLAAFRSRRQMVQRLGRVLRVKESGRVARLVIVHAADTMEDPAGGAHEDFLDDVMEVALAVERIDGDDPVALGTWMDQSWTGSA